MNRRNSAGKQPRICNQPMGRGHAPKVISRIASAPRSRATTAASCFGINVARPLVPPVLMTPAVSRLSLIVIGTPWRGPASRREQAHHWPCATWRALPQKSGCRPSSTGYSRSRCDADAMPPPSPRRTPCSESHGQVLRIALGPAADQIMKTKKQAGLEGQLLIHPLRLDPHDFRTFSSVSSEELNNLCLSQLRRLSREGFPAGDGLYGSGINVLSVDSPCRTN